MMIRLTIDGRIVDVERETPILEAARKLGIRIPTLCYHEGLEPYSSCRLCMVEVVQGRESKLVTSCSYPAEAGLEVLTASEPVRKARRIMVELLLARCPNVPLVRQLAVDMGIERWRLGRMEDHRCLLCGLCVRVCEEMVGVGAIGFVNRGSERAVGTPFGADSDVCIGCGSCTYICPTACIEMVGEAGPARPRSLRMGKLALDACPNRHDCDACETDRQFLREMREVIENLRAKA